MQARVRTGDHAVRADLGQRSDPEFLRLGPAGDHDRSRAIGDLRRRARRDRAVRAEGRPQLAKAVHGGVPSDAFVGGEQHRVTPALRDGHRHDLLGEHAVGDRLRRTLVRASRELVLLLAGEAVAGVVLLRR